MNMSDPNESLVIVAQLNARVQPIDRGEYFEDPLDEVLRSHGFGQVTGGGTQLADEPDGISYCDIEIEINEFSETVISKIIETLELQRAPKGSVLKTFGAGDDVAFGKSEGLAIFLNGTDLPDDVYANSDVNEIISKCDKLLDGIGMFMGYWEGSRETALYFYGMSYTAMLSAVKKYIDSEPSCALSRIEQIA